MNVVELSQLIREKKLSPVEVVQDCLQRIEAQNPDLNAFITVCRTEALAAAKRAEEEIARGQWRGFLHGLPIAVKDLIETKGIRTTMGSQIFADHVPERDATVVQKVRDAGAILIGKTNTHEFAYGPTGDRSFFGAVRNPHNRAKMSGGSSSGSGAAVGGGLVPLALGTDTGGSIRIPSAACGAVGMKPTFGRVSKFGVFPLSQTLDHVGPMTPSVAENAHLLNALAGFDPHDPRSVQRETEDFTRLLDKPLTGKKIGLPTSFYLSRIYPEILAAYQAAVGALEKLGAQVLHVDLPDMQAISDAQGIVIKSEAYSVHERFVAEQPELYDPEVLERLRDSRQVLAYQYVAVQEKRRQWVESFNRVFAEVDLLVTPTLPILPPDLDQREVQIQGRTEAVRSALLRLTGPTNLLGNPSLSMPIGFSKTALPIGLQIIGKHFAEALVYQFASALETYLKQ